MAGGGGGGGGQKNGGGDDMAIVAAVAVAAIAVWLVWTKARGGIIWMTYGPDYVQYWLLDHLGLLDEGGRKLMAWTKWCLDGHVKPTDIDWPNVMAVRNDVGRRMHWVTSGLIGALAIYVTFRMKGEGYKRVFTLTGREKSKVFRVGGLRVDNKLLQFVIRLLLTVTFTKKILLSEKKEWVSKGVSFIHYQAKEWKVVLSGASFDPDKKDPSQAPQRTPMEWLRDNDIRLTKRDGLDDAAAAEHFEKQLGPAWQGVKTAPTHVQAICVMSALNVKRDDAVKKVRDGLSEIYASKSGAEAEKAAKEMLAKHLADEKIVAAIDRHGAKHGFVNTAAIGIYGWGGPMKEWGGGEAGVLSTSMFRWLKKIDRTLWYCLNNVGRRRFHVEAAGAVSHFFAERVVGAALAEPNVETAVDGLADYLDQQGVIDLEDFFRVERDF
jgi:hypothetical protein